MLRAGSLDQRVQLQRRQDVQGASGAITTTWCAVATVSANVRYASGMEAVRNGVQVAAATASVRIRYRRDMAEGTTAAGLWRVIHRGLVHDVQSVLPGPTRLEYLDLVCTAGQSNG
jgi:SPP1 family predicted phage head-tail adaptor